LSGTRVPDQTLHHVGIAVGVAWSVAWLRKDAALGDVIEPLGSRRGSRFEPADRSVLGA